MFIQQFIPYGSNSPIRGYTIQSPIRSVRNMLVPHQPLKHVLGHESHGIFTISAIIFPKKIDRYWF